MPTKDGISGTGVMPGRTHTRREWSARRSAARARESDLSRVIALLVGDHAKVDKLFKRIETLKKREDDSRYPLVIQACEALAVHLALEEELFYPAARRALAQEGQEDEGMVDEGEVEHHHIRELVNDLKAMNENDPLCDAKVKVLMDYVRHHVKEEERELFPALKKMKPDFAGLYDKMVKRREEMKQRGMASAEFALILAKENQYAPH